MGGRFCSLDQTHPECESTLVEIMSFRPRNRVKTKKTRSSRQFGTKFGGNLWDFFMLSGPFLSVQSTLKPRWGTLNLNGGTLNLNEGTLTLDRGARPPRPFAI